jgi:plasmid stabilization system protein ParE
MRFQVIITPLAKADILEINGWWLEYYQHLANDWLLDVKSAVLSLKNFPERCPVSSESEAFDVVVRQLIFGKKPHVYRVLFSIQTEKVYVLRIRSTKQKSILDE